MNWLQDIELFMLDLDGTIYLSNDMFHDSPAFIEALRNKSKKFVYLTNNSSKSYSKYIEKISNMGLFIDKSVMLTSGLATGMLLEEKHRDQKVYVMGTASLVSELSEFDINVVTTYSEDIDVAVAGFDMELTYSKLEDMCKLLDAGKPFYGTNPDLVCPLKGKKYIPDCGSMCIMLENATGRKPEYIGKPSAHLVEIVSKKFNVSKDKIAMVGDRLYTDIALGVNASIKSILVLSGEATAEDVIDSPYKPDLIVNGVGDLIQYL